MMMKRCRKCGETKPVDGFGRDRRAKNGLCSRCKECKKAATAAYRAANPNKVKARYAANADRERARSAAWRAANPDKAKAASDSYRAANPDKVKAWNAAWRAGGRDPDKPWPEGPIGYAAAHRRVEATYGPAGNHDCLHCDGPAAEWGYDYGDPDEFSGPMVDTRNGSGQTRIMRWSGNPSCYMPLCKSCHTKHDKKESAA